MKILFILTALFFSSTVSPQERDYHYYATKSKHQKTVGGILLAGGVLCVAAGGAVASTSNMNFTFSMSNSNSSSSGGLAVCGLGLAVASIPFFSSAKYNARKAESLKFVFQRIPVQGGGVILTRLQPSVSLKVPLGRGPK